MTGKPGPMVRAVLAQLRAGPDGAPILTGDDVALLEGKLAKLFGDPVLLPTVAELVHFASFLRERGHRAAGEAVMAVALSATAALRALGGAAVYVLEALEDAAARFQRFIGARPEPTRAGDGPAVAAGPALRFELAKVLGAAGG